MVEPLKIGIIGDYDPGRSSHLATNEAINHSAKALSVDIGIEWLPTQQLEAESSDAKMKRFTALWCGPGSPYKSMTGALRGIQFCREQGWPFLGT